MKDRKSTPSIPEPGPANWKYWKGIASIELWQGLLLSLNIEPTGGGVFIQNLPDEMALVSHKNGGGFIPYEYMDSKGITTEFLSRWHLIRNKLETAYAASGIRPSVDLTDFIRLPVFALLAVQFDWSPLPCELSAIARGASSNSAGSAINAQTTGSFEPIDCTTRHRKTCTQAKAHIHYLSLLHREYPAATAKELRRLCIDRAKATGSDDHSNEFPFCIKNNDLALKGKQSPVAEKTFSNWMADAKKLG